MIPGFMIICVPTFDTQKNKNSFLYATANWGQTMKNGSGLLGGTPIVVNKSLKHPAAGCLGWFILIPLPHYYCLNPIILFTM